MLESLTLMLALLLGSFLGAVFFGGLWWTIRRGLASNSTALWFLGSIVIRTAIAVFGFYLIGRGDWHRLLACLVGFLLARASVTRLTRTAPLDKAGAA
jgi:F1F0 ATPase subunit 2